MKNEAIKNLLAIDRNALKALHDELHLDYNKPFAAFQIDGRFTVNAIEKLAEKEDHNYFASVIVAMTICHDNTWKKDRLLTATISGGNVNIDYKFFSTQRTKLDHYITKGDFNEIRKRDSITTFVICQKKSDLAEVKDHKPDFTNRFKVKDFSKWGYGNGGGSYIGEVRLIRTDDNGSVYTYNKQGNVYYRGSRPEYETLEDIIDKSGYIVADKRRELMRGARLLREERAKAAYTATDNTSRIAELRKAITEKKNSIAKALTEATTAETVKELTDKLWKYNGLAGIYSYFERLEENDKNKKYSSNETFSKAYSDILSMLNNI